MKSAFGSSSGGPTMLAASPSFKTAFGSAFARGPAQAGTAPAPSAAAAPNVTSPFAHPGRTSSSAHSAPTAASPGGRGRGNSSSPRRGGPRGDAMHSPSHGEGAPLTSSEGNPSTHQHTRGGRGRGHGGLRQRDNSQTDDATETSQRVPPQPRGGGGFTPKQFLAPQQRLNITVGTPSFGSASLDTSSTNTPRAAASPRTPLVLPHSVLQQQQAPRKVTSHTAPDPATDEALDTKCFTLLLDKVWADDWDNVGKLVARFTTDAKWAVPDFRAHLPAWFRALDRHASSARKTENVLAHIACGKAFATAMCLVAYGNGLESTVITVAPADWEQRLAGAFQAFASALRAVAEMLRTVADESSITGGGKMKPFCIVPPLVDRLRLCISRCRAMSVKIDETVLRGSFNALYNAVQRATLTLTAGTTTRDAALAAARIIGELCPQDSMDALTQYKSYVDYMDNTWPGETEALVILHYRFGEGLMANLAFALASKHFARSLALGARVQNRSMQSVLQKLVACKLACGEVPPQELFDANPMPYLEDVALALEAANLKLYNEVLTRYHAVYIENGMMPAIASVKSYVILQMFVKYFVAKCTSTFEIRMQEVRAYFPGQFDEHMDLGPCFVAPMLLAGTIRGYLAGNTLKLSSKNPFPGLTIESLLGTPGINTQQATHVSSSTLPPPSPLMKPLS